MFTIYYVTSYGKVIMFKTVYTTERDAQTMCDLMNDSGLPGAYHVEQI